MDLTRLLICCALAHACIGCGGLQSVPSGAETEPAPRTASREPWSPTVLVPRVLRMADEATDATLRILARHVRMEYGRGLTIAEETAPGIRTVEYFGDAAYFWDVSGAVLRAEGSYVGPLTEVARAPSPFMMGLGARGLLAALTDDGRVFLFTPEDGVYTPATPVDTGVRDAAWSTRDMGVALRRDGTLWRVLDGGRRVEPLAIVGDATEVIPRNDAVYVYVDESRWARVTSGAVTYTDAPGATFRDLPDDAEVALVHRLGPLVAWARRAMPGQDGSTGTLDDGRLRWWVRDPGGAHERGPAGCWGEQIEGRWIALCENGAEIRFARDLEHWQIHRMPAPVEVVTWAIDGSSVVVGGHCELDRDEHGACWTDGGPPRLLPLEEGATVLAVHRSTVWIHTEGQIVALDANTSLRRTLDDDAGLVSARATVDGALVVLRRQAGALRVTLHAADGTSSWPIPLGALDVAYADTLHAIAIGDDWSELWTTSDGGATFAPIELERVGSPEQHRLDPAWLECAGGGCRVADIVFFGPTRLRRVEGPHRLVFPPLSPPGG